jgi:hypothetical protein
MHGVDSRYNGKKCGKNNIMFASYIKYFQIVVRTFTVTSSIVTTVVTMEVLVNIAHVRTYSTPYTKSCSFIVHLGHHCSVALKINKFPRILLP